MRLDQVNFGAGLPIDSYGEGGFRIGGTFLKSSLIALPQGPLPWAAASLADADASNLAPLFERVTEIDILLVGSGSRLIPMPGALRQLLMAQGFFPDLMDTGAAARTFNVLLAERRRVAALLIAV